MSSLWCSKLFLAATCVLPGAVSAPRSLALTMADDAYANVVTGGKLKLKKVKKSKKTKGLLKKKPTAPAAPSKPVKTCVSLPFRPLAPLAFTLMLGRRVDESHLDEFEKAKRGKKRPRSSPDAAEDDGLPASLTAAERAFLKHREEHVEARELTKVARKSHRQRIDEMNAYLAALPVHNDVPKVAAAGLG